MNKKGINRFAICAQDYSNISSRMVLYVQKQGQQVYFGFLLRSLLTPVLLFLFDGNRRERSRTHS